MFGNVHVAFRQIFKNLRIVVGNLRKIVRNIVISMLIYYMALSRLDFRRSLVFGGGARAPFPDSGW